MITFTWWQILSNLLLATRWTLALSLITFLAGGALGLMILTARMSRFRPLRIACRAYIEVFQGTPLLMQLFLAYFALSLIGLRLPPFAAAVIALTLWSSAFFAEIWRGCVQSVDRGQWEGSASLGMGYIQQMRYIILPQAMRLAVPPTVAYSVQIVKATALTSIIGFVELSRAGAMISNATFRPMEVYGIVALIYFLLCWPLSKLSSHLEQRLNVAYRNH